MSDKPTATSSWSGCSLPFPRSGTEASWVSGCRVTRGLTRPRENTARTSAPSARLSVWSLSRLSELPHAGRTPQGDVHVASGSGERWLADKFTGRFPQGSPECGPLLSDYTSASSRPQWGSRGCSTPQRGSRAPPLSGSQSASTQGGGRKHERHTQLRGGTFR